MCSSESLFHSSLKQHYQWGFWVIIRSQFYLKTKWKFDSCMLLSAEICVWVFWGMEEGMGVFRVKQQSLQQTTWYRLSQWRLFWDSWTGAENHVLSLSMFWAAQVRMTIRCCQKNLFGAQRYKMTDLRWAPLNGTQSSQTAAKSLLHEMKNCAWGLFVLGFTTERKYLYHECLSDARHLKLFLYKPLCKWPLVCSRCCYFGVQMVGNTKMLKEMSRRYSFFSCKMLLITKIFYLK